jgi:hypothetical protein
MDKIKNLSRKRLFLIVSLLLMLGFFGFVWAQNSGSNIKVCTSNVEQPACYAGAFPTPKLRWTVMSDPGGMWPGSSQERYRVQIDNNSNFSSPEIDSGVVISENFFHQVNEAGLSFNTPYYWRVTVRDGFLSWTGWAVADSSFTTVTSCNNPPKADNLSVVKGDYCSSPSHFFSWTYSDSDGHTQSKFQFQMDNNSNFSSPEINRTQDGLSNPSPTTNNQTVIVAVSPSGDQIGYNTTYYWRVKVWDSIGDDSGWISGSSITTEKHRYPTINFSWSPENPSEEEDVAFTDGSTVYGGATKSSWLWTFKDGNPANSVQQHPTIQFTDNGSKTVTLKVTDSDGYFCTGTGPSSVNVQFTLPDWREILPW